MRAVDALGKGSTYRRKDGRWVYAVTIGYDGKGRQVRRSVSASTEKALGPKRLRLMQELLAGDTSKKRITVATWMEQWLATTAFKRLSPRVLANYQSINRKHITPAIGAYRLVDVGAAEVRELHDAVAESGASDRTVQIVHGVLSVAMKTAMREGLINRNPTELVDRPRASSNPRGALTVLEAGRVIRAAPDHTLGSLFTMLLLTATRKSEAMGLEPNRLDLGGRVADVSWQLQRVPWAHGAGCGCAQVVTPERCPQRVHSLAPGFEAREVDGGLMLTRPKTMSSTRVVPIIDYLARVLDEHLDAAPPGPLVWHHDGRPLSATEVAGAWRDLLDDAGVRRVDMHTTRHTTASLLLEAGVPMEVISQIMGHSSVLSTRGYMHVGLGQKQEAMRSLGGLLGLAE